MATIPHLRKVQPATFSPSRRRAISQSTVASDPVTERFGPRSTPMRTASRTWALPDGLQRGACQQARGQVVHQIGERGDAE